MTAEFLLTHVHKLIFIDFEVRLSEANFYLVLEPVSARWPYKFPQSATRNAVGGELGGKIT